MISNRYQGSASTSRSKRLTDRPLVISYEVTKFFFTNLLQRMSNVSNFKILYEIKSDKARNILD